MTGTDVAASGRPRPSRDDALARDAADTLAPLRDLFALPEGVVYLDGNSLGALPRRTAARVQRTIGEEWGTGLIRSWNDAGWIGLGRSIGDAIGKLIGAGAGETSVGDSTSVNLFKVLSAAAALQKADAPTRRTIVSERGNFPTDLYIADSVAASAGLALRLAGADGLVDRIDRDTAVLLLTHVDYRSGRMHDMAELTRIAHAAGALVVWDLAHSAGAVPVDLHGADADFAVGCGYKYLNGGPGAPAFVWAHPRHTARMDREGCASRCPAGSATQRRSLSRPPTARRRASTASSAARRPSWPCAPCSAASRCSPRPMRSAASPRCATSRSS